MPGRSHYSVKLPLSSGSNFFFFNPIVPNKELISPSKGINHLALKFSCCKHVALKFRCCKHLNRLDIYKVWYTYIIKYRVNYLIWNKSELPALWRIFLGNLPNKRQRKFLNSQISVCFSYCIFQNSFKQRVLPHILSGEDTSSIPKTVSYSLCMRHRYTYNVHKYHGWRSYLMVLTCIIFKGS